jgi:hypothetical protein
MARMTFFDVPQGCTALWLEKIAIENNCKVESKKWNSRLDEAIFYDYMPAFPENFKLCITIVSPLQDKINFVNWSYSNRFRVIE